MTASPKALLHQDEPDGPGREAIDVLYRFVAAIELVPTVAIHSTDRNGLVRFWNRRCTELFGISARDALGRPLASLAIHHNEAEFAAMLEAVWKTGEPHARDWQIDLRDGSKRWLYSTHFPVRRDGKTQQLFCMEIDVTDRKTQDGAASHSERNLMMAAQVFDNCRDAILVLDRDVTVISVNQAFCKLMGYAPEEVVGREAPSLRSGVHDQGFYQEIWDYVGKHDHWEGEIWARRRDGLEFPCWVALTAIRSGRAELADYMAILSDITDRKRVEEQNRHLAEHDFLTDLPNRVLLLDRLRQALAAARRQHTKVAVMFIDLDRFKAINDGFGHQAGDQVLKETAARLMRCVRGVDTVSRHGGDEFVVILADIGGVDQAARVAQTVMHAVVQPFNVAGHDMTVSVSIGISIYPSDGADIDMLMQHADVAMYHAKQDGRNAFRFFSPEMNAHMVQRVH